MQRGPDVVQDLCLPLGPPGGSLPPIGDPQLWMMAREEVVTCCLGGDASPQVL